MESRLWLTVFRLRLESSPGTPDQQTLALYPLSYRGSRKVMMWSANGLQMNQIAAGYLKSSLV